MHYFIFSVLEVLWGHDLSLLLEQLSETSCWQKCFALVEQFLLEKFEKSNQTIRTEIQWAWNQLECHGGSIPIRRLVEGIGWSDRHFSSCFREHIGVTPKVAARRIRFTRAHQLLTTSDHHALSDIAAICGYSDQSHFTREFHLFAGCSPAIYQQAQFSDFPGVSGDIISSHCNPK